MTEQYKCPSYYDDNGVLQDCTCGKCGSKADWLRSEIKKLEVMMKNDITTTLIDFDEKTGMFGHCIDNRSFNQALTSIITRYKEELKELTGE